MEEFRNDEKLFNIVPLNGGEIQNYVIFVKVAKWRRILKLRKIINLVPLKRE